MLSMVVVILICCRVYHYLKILVFHSITLYLLCPAHLLSFICVTGPSLSHSFMESHSISLIILLLLFPVLHSTLPIFLSLYFSASPSFISVFLHHSSSEVSPFVENSGLHISSYFSALKVFWLLDNEDLFSKVLRVFTGSDNLLARATHNTIPKSLVRTDKFSKCDKILNAVEDDGFTSCHNQQRTIAFHASSGREDKESNDSMNYIKSLSTTTKSTRWTSLVEGYCIVGDLNKASVEFEIMTENEEFPYAGYAFELLDSDMLMGWYYFSDMGAEMFSGKLLLQKCGLVEREFSASYQFNFLVRHFEKSLGSTWMTLKLISESSMTSGVQPFSLNEHQYVKVATIAYELEEEITNEFYPGGSSWFAYGGFTIDQSPTGNIGLLLDTCSIVLKEIIGATPSSLLEELLGMIGIAYLPLECSKSKERKNRESFKLLEAAVEAEISNANIVEMSITTVTENLTPNHFGAVLKPTRAIHVTKLLKYYRFPVVRMIVKSLPLLISYFSVSSLTRSAIQACLLEGELACAKISYGAFAPVVICYNAEHSYKLEPITNYKENGSSSRKVAALLHRLLRFLSYGLFHKCQEGLLEHCSKVPLALSSSNFTFSTLRTRLF